MANGHGNGGGWWLKAGQTLGVPTMFTLILLFAIGISVRWLGTHILLPVSTEAVTVLRAIGQTQTRILEEQRLTKEAQNQTNELLTNQNEVTQMLLEEAKFNRGQNEKILEQTKPR